MKKKKKFRTLVKIVLFGFVLFMGYSIYTMEKIRLNESTNTVTPTTNQQTQATTQQRVVPTFNQVGYWKGENNHRVFTFDLPQSMTEREVRNHAERQMHTSGRTTYVFYYSANTPNPTQASSRDRALEITERGDCVYSFVKLANGNNMWGGC